MLGLYAVDTPQVVGCFTLIIAMGMGITLAARLAEGGRFQTFSQWMFLAGLASVGGATIAALSIGSGCWPVCGASLIGMVVAATLDLNGDRQSAISV